MEVEVIATTSEVVKSEEGFLIQPHKTVDEFVIDDYECLILPGCSDSRISLRDKKIKSFLEQFRDNDKFIIGAICAGPQYLAQAGLLKGKKYTASLYEEMYELFSFFETENRVYAPVVVDGNIITAIGTAFDEFALEVVKRLGYDVPERFMSKPHKNWSEEDYKHRLDEAGLKMFKEEFYEFF